MPIVLCALKDSRGIIIEPRSDKTLLNATEQLLNLDLNIQKDGKRIFRKDE